jgi:hypothetical protein
MDCLIESHQHDFGPAEAFTRKQLAEVYDINALSPQRVNLPYPCRMPLDAIAGRERRSRWRGQKSFEEMVGIGPRVCSDSAVRGAE